MPPFAEELSVIRELILAPVQMLSLSVKLAVGVGKTVKFCFEVSIHPLLLVTCSLSV